jgi:AcrR family transcriptional regulator
MPAQSSLSEPSSDGWRARKRQQTRERIADAGLRLFLDQGFEATTLDAIAEAAGIARRTFFHYFDSKEALLFAYEGEMEQSLRAAVAGIDSVTPPFEAMVMAMEKMISSLGTERARAIDSILQSSEALRAGKHAHYVRLENILFLTLAEKWPASAGQARLRLISMVGVGALRLAVEQWRTEKALTLQGYLNVSLAALRSELLT